MAHRPGRPRASVKTHVEDELPSWAVPLRRRAYRRSAFEETRKTWDRKDGCTRLRTSGALTTARLLTRVTMANTETVMRTGNHHRHGDHDRDEVRGWYNQHHDHLPPGLQKRICRRPHDFPTSWTAVCRRRIASPG
jgi:hypothetical protein